MDDIVRIRKCLAGDRGIRTFSIKYKNLVYGIALSILHNKDEAARCYPGSLSEGLG